MCIRDRSTDLAEFVMQECGVDYRTAYDVVGATVRGAVELGLRGIDITGEMLDDAAARLGEAPLGLSGRDLTEVLDPAAIVRTRVTRGGAAPEVVRGMARDCLAAAQAAGAAARDRRAAFAAAEQGLLTRAAELSRQDEGRPDPHPAAGSRADG